MKKWTIVFGLVFCFSLSYSQEGYVERSFPDEWLGYYEGLMYIVNPIDGLVDSVDVTLTMEETNRENIWTYIMTYDNPTFGKMTKDYLITQPDSLSEGQFWMDEQNGIRILEVLMGNAMYSSFEVEGNQINTIMRNMGDYIDFELISTNTGMLEISSSNPTEEYPEVYEVTSYPPLATQYVRLFRKE